MVLNGHVLQEGDILIGVGKHSCEVKFVEGADHSCVLLVDGREDEQFLPQEYDLIQKKYRLLCKKEDRLDLL